MKKIINREQAQEEHLNAMIYLAFQQMEMQEIQEIMQEKTPFSASEEKEMKHHIACNIQKKLEEERKNSKKTTNKKSLYFRVVHIAACFVLLLFIATPIALASSPVLREKIMQLFIQMDNQKEEIHFELKEIQQGEDQALQKLFENWQGTYYPSYIPQDMQVKWESTYTNTVEYEAKDKRSFSFSEFDEDVSFVTGTKNAVVRDILLNGQKTYIVEGKITNTDSPCITLAYKIEEKLIVLCTEYMSLEETMRIAESIQKIN